MSSRELPCWIEGFSELTAKKSAPSIFRTWSAITAVGGALERRVWTSTSVGPVYPNMFVMLVAPPGVGKTQVIQPVREFWGRAKKLNLAPNNTTKPSLLDELKDAGRMEIMSDGGLLQYHSLLVAASEFGVFCPSHDLEFLSVLCDLYDCDNNYRERRRSQSEQIDIVNPQITILTGVQPEYLAQFLPAAAWGQGFMSRMIMIYSDQTTPLDLFGEVQEDTSLQTALQADMDSMAKEFGHKAWTDNAKRVLTTWYLGGRKPEPEHFKLKHYNTRRHLHVIKLSLISACSRNHENIEDKDVQRAINWLLEAEAFMPEIFKSMMSRSDGDVIREFQMYVTTQFRRTGKPLHESQLVSYLSERTPAYNVARVLEVAIKSGLIVNEAGKPLYKPGEGRLDPTIE